MRVLITGVCGFVGSTLARAWVEAGAGHTLMGMDNLARPGSETNRQALRRLGVAVRHGDTRLASDVGSLPDVDWVVDAAANPTVLAGCEGAQAARQVVEHNLLGTVNLLEYCRERRAGLVLLSTSRVYSIAQLGGIRLETAGDAFRPVAGQCLAGLSEAGVSEAFSTEAPLSLYGATKRASEQLALEYRDAFGIPVWVDRCGVLAGAGQFGRADQGIFSFWIHSWARRRPLAYTGFGGFQVRDCLHPRDLLPLFARQMEAGLDGNRRPVVNVSGGMASACSLRQLSAWCAERFSPMAVGESDQRRRFDVPWLVLDSRAAGAEWDWSPAIPRAAILEEIAAHAERHPDWLDVSHD